MTCTVTGVLRNLKGEALPFATLSLVRRGNVVAQEGAAVVPNLVDGIVADAGGNVTFEALPGNYEGRIFSDLGAAGPFSVGIPQEETINLSEAIDNFPEISPSLVTEAQDAANRAEAAADRAEAAAGDSWRPEDFGATGVGNDAAALNDWLASVLPKSAEPSRVYSFSAALTVPNGTIINGTLNLVWIGVGSVPILTIGNDCKIENLTINVPSTTGNSATIGTGYQGRSIRVTGFGNSGAGFLTIANPAGLDLDLLESTGGFQRPFTIGNGETWSTGGRVGMLRVRDYTRGVGLNYLDGFRLEGYDIQGQNALASFTAGHNGIIAAGLRNCRFGPGIIANAGEHLFRLGGTAEMGASYNNTFGDMILEAPGGCYIKLNANAIAYDFRFGDINAVGRFASVPGGNREFLRLSHCRDLTFGVCRLVVGDGFAYSAQDALALNDIDGVYVQALHVEGLGQSVVDYASGQDIGEGLGNGDVRNISIGALTGTDLTNRTMVRFAMTTGFEAGSLTISSIDYFSDGPLFSANGSTVVDSPCTIGPGRIRKTDLTTLPSTTNLPATISLDLEIGQRRVKNVGGALSWGDTVSPEDFGAVGNGVADDNAAMSAFLAFLMANPKVIGRASGSYRINTDFLITSPIKLDMLGATVIQTVSPFGFIQLRAGSGGSVIENLRVIADLDTPRGLITTRYRGYVAAQRHCALWVESGENTIRNIYSEGMLNTLCLRGPHVGYPAGAGYTGADTDPNTAVDYSSFAENNLVSDIHGKNQDFAITGHQQKNLRLTNWSLRDVVETNDAPPHAVYMRSNGTGVTAGYLIGCHFTGGHCYNSPDGVAHKFHDALGCSFSDLSDYGSSGTSNFIDCRDCSWSNLTGHDQAGDNATARYSHNFEGCSGRINGMYMEGVASNTLGLLEVTDGVAASNLILHNAAAVTDFRAANGITEVAIRVAGASKLLLRGLDYTSLGDDARYILQTANTATIIASDLSCTGTTNLANGAGGSIHLNYDPVQMAGAPLANAGTVTTSLDERTVQFEHGTSTTLYGTTTPGTHTYTTRRCFVERVGNRVTLSIELVVNGAFSGTGNVRFGPLPYAISTGSGIPNVDMRQLITTADNITVAGGSLLVAALIDGTDYIGLQTVTGITRANITNTSLASNAAFQCQISYYTTAAF